MGFLRSIVKGRNSLFVCACRGASKEPFEENYGENLYVMPPMWNKNEQPKMQGQEFKNLRMPRMPLQPHHKNLRFCVQHVHRTTRCARKAAHNGVINFSLLDGWWIEDCVEGVTGWAIGPSPKESIGRARAPKERKSHKNLRIQGS